MPVDDDDALLRLPEDREFADRDDGKTKRTMGVLLRDALDELRLELKKEALLRLLLERALDDRLMIDDDDALLRLLLADVELIDREDWERLAELILLLGDRLLLRDELPGELRLERKEDEEMLRLLLNDDE